eukprot:Nk52_evm12s235 gene=Nk52_evmTU12s235
MELEEFYKCFGAQYEKEERASINTERLFDKIHSELRVNKEYVTAIKILRQDGFKVAALTNNWKLTTPVGRPASQEMATTLGPLFHCMVESCVEGVRKPDPRIFSILLDRLGPGIEPHQVLFLDDLGVNVKAARDMGFQTIKVEEPIQALREMEGILGEGIQLSHYIPGTIRVRADRRLDIDVLASYLNAQGVDGFQDVQSPNAEGRIADVRQFNHGRSNPTFYVRRQGPVSPSVETNAEYVLRKQPPGKLLKGAHAVDREYLIMDAVQDILPVPKLHVYCEDTNVVGTPFYFMDYVKGRVFRDPLLREVGSVKDKRALYESCVDILARIHQDVPVLGTPLEKLGSTELNYCSRQIRTWWKQYEASKTQDVKSMTLLHQWLTDNVPEQERACLVHGDYRMDQLIFHPQKSEVLAVLDWELATIGDPWCDVATSCLGYFLPKDFPLLPSLGGVREGKGIPTLNEFYGMYLERAGQEPNPHWPFYLSFSLFRAAAICQGVLRRSMAGQDSSPQSEKMGLLVDHLAKQGLAIIEGKISTNSQNSSAPYQYSKTSSGVRGYHSSSLAFRPDSAFSSDSPETSYGPSYAMKPSEYVVELREKLTNFMEEYIYPCERVFIEHSKSENCWEICPLMEELKVKAKDAGLWNLFLPVDSNKYVGANVGAGMGLTNAEYAPLCEIMGRSVFAPEVFNCSAPDTGNMEVLARYGTDFQKGHFLKPLLSGEWRSCFAMTEPAVASSDATNIEASVILDSSTNEYVLNGTKWWTSGACDPRCKFAIFMGKTDLSAPKHKQHTMILVPMDTQGVEVKRPLSVFGYMDAPHGHAEVSFTDVRVPANHVILGEGRGFEIAQGRLGPGRIHHCMRLIGMAERSLELMVARVKAREAFGRPLAEHGSMLRDIGESRLDIHSLRLMVLDAGYKMDTVGNKNAKEEIALIKLATPRVVQQVVDRAIQAHGGGGVSDDVPLAFFWTMARTLRLADGPDEVHREAVAKMELKRATLRSVA